MKKNGHYKTAKHLRKQTQNNWAKQTQVVAT